MNNTKLDDIDILFEEATAVKPKKAHKRVVGKKTIKVKSSTETAREAYKKARKAGGVRIKALKHAINAEKLLIKQAKNTYKIIRESEKAK